MRDQGQSFNVTTVGSLTTRTGLNVGSGQRPFTSTPEIEWINVDKIAHPGMPQPDLICDGAHLPYEDGSVDYFVLHHCIEHLWPGHAKLLIQEAYRVLKADGSLLVFVPDMRELGQRWVSGEISTQIYMTNVYGAYMGNEEDFHRWGFDGLSLLAFLSEIPWVAVEPFHYRVIPGASICQDWWILGMECVR